SSGTRRNFVSRYARQPPSISARLSCGNLSARHRVDRRDSCGCSGNCTRLPAVSLVCIAWLLRGLLRPYSQLVGEAKRAPVAHSGKSQNEAAFVLETFQSVIARLQEQQKELQRLSDQASQRADSAEAFSDRIVASMPTGLIAFDANGRVTVINGPAQNLFKMSYAE